MLNKIKKLLGTQPAAGSKDIAKERLRLVLVHDRTQVSPQYMGLIKEDMIKVVSNYMDINPQEMELNLNREDQTVTLVANIPISAVKRSPTAHEPVQEPNPPSEPCTTTREGLIKDAEPTTTEKS